MEIEQLKEYLEDPDKLISELQAERPFKSDVLDKTTEQYQPDKHDIFDIIKRPDKKILKSTDDEGTTQQTSVPVARLALPLQKKIVAMAATFLCGNGIKINAAADQDTHEEKLLQVMQKSWDDNKLNYKNMQLCKILMSELEVAELWYTVKAGEEYWLGTPIEKAENKLKMRIIARSLGDTLYPSFNMEGDMIAFARSYITGEDVEHLDIYTDERIYQLERAKGGKWLTKKNVANPVNKIPVIYYKQESTEWADVQTLIDRLETSISRHADTNDYFGSPMVKIKGAVKGFAGKGEDGKMIELENDGEAEYLTWNQSPESVKLEQENLRSLILDLTDTPDISFKQMQGLGTYSGIALKMLFMGAHMKAAAKEEIFGEGVQRRLNYMRAALIKIAQTKLASAIKLVMRPEFNYYLPKDMQEDIDNLVTAVSGGIMSKATAVEKNPLVDDPDEEMERISTEKEAIDKAATELDKLNNDEDPNDGN